MNSQENVSVSRSNTSMLAARKPLSGWKLWSARSAFLLLFLLLLVFIRLGHDTYVKFLVLRSTGIDSSVDSEGKIILQPQDGLPAADAGFRAGDNVLSVNGVAHNQNIPVEEILRSIPLVVHHRLTIDVRSSGGVERRIEIALNEPHSSLLGLTVLQVTQYQILLDILLVLGFSIPTLIIFWRKSADHLGLFVAFTLLLMAFRFANISLYILNPLLILLGFVLYAVSRVMLLIFLFIFPDGRFIPRWTRPFAWVGGGWAGLSLLFPPFYTTSGQLMDIAIFATGLWAQIYRYRRVSNLQEKQQTKWILSGLIIAYLVGYLFTLMQFLPSVRESGLTYLRFQLIGQLFFVLAILAIPVTVSISIFRHRLYEIDILINRALVYGALTAILSGMAVAMGGFFQRLFMATTGQQSESAVIITTLIVVSAMTPIKDSLQVLVDKRFKESPDPQKKLQLFITQLHGRLFPASVQEMTRKLLEEVVLAFDVKSGAIFLDGQKTAHETRGWDGNPQIVIPVNSEGKSYGQLALGKRGNGAEYTSRDCDLLREVAQATAIAIDQDEQTETRLLSG